MTSPLTDNELIVEFQRGNLDAFEMLVLRHQDQLINFFYHCSGDRQLSEDYTQDVFVRLVSYLDRYSPKAKFTTFLYKVARNMWIDKLRAERVRPRPVSLESPISGGERCLKDTIEGKSQAPGDAIAHHELGETLEAVIESLPEDLRVVLVLSEIQGLKYREISEVLDVPIGTVKSRMHSAVETLRKKLSGKDLAEEEEE
ncbi:MAG: hypothetical protein A2Z34_07335 [Planctomycetes bacterium RBG_16_59_8]|nr:MAG: hypothetical protein A2Z34_07335 [Planctomycetes bacterium RBG_16_59_8]